MWVLALVFLQYVSLVGLNHKGNTSKYSFLLLSYLQCRQNFIVALLS
uniref:Uncharacterized protein n=1 Tax=Rhizophora mucronata TaxID=61149 RepID=A0A2P2PDE3_RHIMU